MANRNIFTDRNIIHDNGNTIFWSEFSSFLGLPNNAGVDYLMNRKLSMSTPDGSVINDDFDYGKIIARTIIKLNSLGVLETEHATRAGTTSAYDINRFHITFFGQKILDYLD